MSHSKEALKSLKELLREDRTKEKEKRWTGTFSDYWEKVLKNPSLALLSHARESECINREGFVVLDDERTTRIYGRKKIKVPKIFADKFFGIPLTLEKIVEFYNAAKAGLEQSRQVLYLMGPVGSGKSSLTIEQMKILEKSGLHYAINGCPMQEEPLHLISQHMRPELQKELDKRVKEKKIKERILIEGDLDPVCRFRLKEEDKIIELKKKFERIQEFRKSRIFSDGNDGVSWEKVSRKLGPEKTDDLKNTEQYFDKQGRIIWQKAYTLFDYRDQNNHVLWEKFPVSTFEFSKRARRGLVSVPPVDPTSQDITELIGAEDIAQLHKYSLGDPRLTLLIGAFNAGNRGIVEFIEIFENEPEYLQSMLTATQEKMIPAPGKQTMIYFDGVIVGHSNEPQWNKFKSDPENVNYIDRIVKINVPYTTELSAEIQIYEKLIATSQYADVHYCPHTLRIAAMLPILSRLKESERCDPITKMRLHDGEPITKQGTSQRFNVQELKEEFPNEGMEGLSTRFVVKAIGKALVRTEHRCITPIRIREALVGSVKDADFPDDIKKKYLGFLQDQIHKEYLKILEKEIEKAATPGFIERTEIIFQKYLDDVERFVLAGEEEEEEWDEKFMQSIEAPVGIVGDAARGFRQDVWNREGSLRRKGKKLDWKSYPPLKDAIEANVIAAARDLCRIIIKAKARDKKQMKKYNEMEKAMIKEMGYCVHCVPEVLEYAHDHLWRD